MCLEAQLAAVDGIKPGMSGVEADAISRKVIADSGFGDNFGHGLGHGVGIFIHEAPRALDRGRPDALEVGNVLTIEPGIYLPGVGGVRIEDLAVVREDGLEPGPSFPKRPRHRRLNPRARRRSKAGLVRLTSCDRFECIWGLRCHYVRPRWQDARTTRQHSHKVRTKPVRLQPGGLCRLWSNRGPRDAVGWSLIAR